jgi:hypothetical protein
MATAVAQERRAFELSIAPATLASPHDQNSRVDESAGIIRRVKVLGFSSRNLGRTIGLSRDEFGAAADQPYSYSRQALEAAASLYEGAKVYNNHTEFGYDETTGKRIVTGTDRENEDLIGWLENVAIEGDGSKDTDGMYADLCVITSHSMAKPLFEVARRRPQIIALSHEAYWDNPTVKGGRIVLNAITHVDCVALVSAKPGTTRGLFETAAPAISAASTSNKGTKTVKLTLKKLVESLVAANAPGRKVLEDMMGGDYGAALADVPVEVPADAGSEKPSGKPEDQIKAGILAAVMAKLDKASEAEMLAVLEALGLGDSLSAAAAGKTGGAGGKATEQAGEAGKKNDEEKAMETAANNGKGGAGTPDRGNLILECVGILRECEVGDYHETALEAMANLPTKEKRLAFARSIKPVGQIKPRSQSPDKPVLETAAKPNGVDFSKDLDGAARRLRGVA